MFNSVSIGKRAIDTIMEKTMEDYEKSIALSFIPCTVKRQLYCHLDIPVEANWEALAAQLEVPPQEISWIKHNPGDGYTHKLFECISHSKFVDDLLVALKETGNLAAFSCLSDAYPVIEQHYRESLRRLTRKSDQRTELKVPLGRERRENEPSAVSNGCNVMIPQQREPSPVRVALTCAEDGILHSRSIHQCLLDNKITSAIITTDDETQLEYASSCFQKARYIVIVVTEGYLSVINASKSLSKPSLAGKIARHIFRLTTIELCQNACVNHRFIPVLCGTVSRRNLPSMLANTKVYSWPKGWESLMRLLSSSNAR